MTKIPKDLADKDMFKDYKEDKTVESMFLALEEKVDRQPGPKKRSEREKLQLAYLTPVLQEKLGKALLDLKMVLYKEGIVEYDIKVKRDGQKIVLLPIEHKKKV
ncbi:MAG: hypothetical protein WCS30_07210 [Selenomonadaceae bacterium]